MIFTYLKRYDRLVCRAVRIPYKQKKREIRTTSVRISLFWRKRGDSLRKQCLLSRLSRKQPFHRLFGRLVAVKYSLFRLLADCRAVRIPYKQKKEKHKQQVFVFLFFGGSEGIRTPEPVKTTRFPIVPVMTTSIRFLIFFAYLFANCLYILYFFSNFVNDF